MSFCTGFVTEMPGWMLETKLSLLCVLAAAGTEGQLEADARCVAGCIFRHIVLHRSLLVWELWAALTGADGPVLLQWSRK